MSILSTIMLVPTAYNVHLTSTAMGISEAFQQKQIPVHFFKPVQDSRLDEHGDDVGFDILQRRFAEKMVSPIPHKKVAEYIADDKIDDLLEEIVKLFEANKQQNSIAIVEGITIDYSKPYARMLNHKIATAIGAEIIFVSSPHQSDRKMFNDHIASMAGEYSKNKQLGAIICNTSAPLDNQGQVPNIGNPRTDNMHALSAVDIKTCPIFKSLPILGLIPYSQDIEAPRPVDVANYLQADIIHDGDMETRRITDVAMVARTLPNSIDFLKTGNLIFTPADRTDIIMASALSATVGQNIAGLVLTGGHTLHEPTMALCMQSFKQSQLPVFSTNKGAWEVACDMASMTIELPKDDIARIQKVSDYFASHIDETWVEGYMSQQHKTPLTPPAFKYRLIEKAQSTLMTIVLPEGEEPRTIQAAAISAQKQMAKCILIGNRDTIIKTADDHNVDLQSSPVAPYIEIIDPTHIADDYVDRLVELRGHKGVNEVMAKQQLEDTVVLATMMIEAGKADGLVSGAVHTTANTIRPPLQIIKTAPNASMVSSVFFMCLPEQVLVYGDCAINPNPNAEQLAEIAIQSADSATAFGIEARVAMISYSTGSSGAGDDVEKVTTATHIIKAKRPDIVVDGPLQYDAAVVDSVAKSKAPDSPVAGQATVLIFPDLNTGNTTYKAVQRSAQCVSIGPMLQGIRKPVNDLSRGALVDDIVYTIALTAVQAQES